MEILSLSRKPEDRITINIWNCNDLRSILNSPLADLQQSGCISCHDCGDNHQCPHVEAWFFDLASNFSHCPQFQVYQWEKEETDQTKRLWLLKGQEEAHVRLCPKTYPAIPPIVPSIRFIVITEAADLQNCPPINFSWKTSEKLTSKSSWYHNIQPKMMLLRHQKRQFNVTTLWAWIETSKIICQLHSNPKQ